MKRATPSEHPDLGFQIAPMIDVVFVILLYFMVMAGAVKMEYEIKTTLPGNAEVVQTTDDPPEEVSIGITESGEITINDNPVAGPDDVVLNDLFAEMSNLAQMAKQSNMKIVVTVSAEETVKYNRIMNVLDILAKAKVSNVTFSTTDADDY